MRCVSTLGKIEFKTGFGATQIIGDQWRRHGRVWVRLSPDHPPPDFVASDTTVANINVVVNYVCNAYSV